MLGLWLRYVDHPTVLRWIGLFGALIVLYSAHIYGFAIAGVVVTAHAILRRLPISQMLLSWLLFVPGCLLYMLTQVRTDVAHNIEFAGLAKKAGWLLLFPGVHIGRIDPIDLSIYGALLLFAALALWKNGDLDLDRRWIAIAALLFSVYWLLPNVYGEGDGIHIRLLPFLVIIFFTGARFGHREKSLAAVAVILFGLRMTSITHEFLTDQPRLAEIARSFGVTAANSRVLPFVELGTSSARLFKPVHFWGYGIIQRGWLSPYLFSIPGIHSLRPLTQPYPPYGLWGSKTVALVDWELVCKSYDYVWAYNVPQLSPRLHELGDVVAVADSFEMYRIRRPSARCP